MRRSQNRIILIQRWIMILLVSFFKCFYLANLWCSRGVLFVSGRTLWALGRRGSWTAALPARASASRQSVTEAPVGYTDKEKILEPPPPPLPPPPPYFPARLHVVCKPKIPPPHLSLRACLSPPLSPLLVHQCASSSILSNARAVWIVFCSTSKCPQTPWKKKKKKLSKGLFLHFEVRRFVLFLSPRFAHLVPLWWWRCLISEDPPYPYQWLPFIWCHWKEKKHTPLAGGGGEYRESIELNWNYFSWGRKTLCSLRYWIARGPKENGDTYAVVQRIINSYINYWGNCCQERKKKKRKKGVVVFSEYHFLKVPPPPLPPPHTGFADILVGLGKWWGGGAVECLFQTADGVFSLYNLTSLLSEEYCVPTPMHRVHLFSHTKPFIPAWQLELLARIKKKTGARGKIQHSISIWPPGAEIKW